MGSTWLASKLIRTSARECPRSRWSWRGSRENGSKSTIRGETRTISRVRNSTVATVQSLQSSSASTAHLKVTANEKSINWNSPYLYLGESVIPLSILQSAGNAIIDTSLGVRD